MNDKEQDIDIKSFFVPLTDAKAIIFILVVGFLIFTNTLLNGFVWDDISNIIYNPNVHTLSTSNIFGKNNINVALQYRPVLSFYFSLLYSIFTDTPFFYHFFNIIFHLVNCILVFLFFKKFISRPLSLFLTLIFTVHPMQVESVAWISSAGNLYFTFGMISLLLCMRNKMTIRSAILSGVFLLLSILSKETGFLFAFLIIMYFFLFKKARIIAFLKMAFPLVFFYIFLRFVIGHNYFSVHSEIVPIAKFSLLMRAINIPEIFLYYLVTFLYPAKLSIMQFWVISQINYESFILPLLVDSVFIAGIFGAGIYFFLQKNKKEFYLFLFTSLWFAVGMILSLQIFPLDMTVSDRWFYFPMVGLLGMIGLGISRIIQHNKSPWIKRIFYGLFVLLIIFLSVRTIMRNSNWRDDLTLYNHDKKIHDNFVIESNIGWNYQHINDFKTANKYYKKSVDMFGGWAISLNNLAYSYEVLGNKKKAIEVFYKVLSADDLHDEEYENDLVFASYILLMKESAEVSRDFTEKALMKKPQNASLWTYLALSNVKLNKQSEALKDIKKAYNLDPSNITVQSIYNKINQVDQFPN